MTFPLNYLSRHLRQKQHKLIIFINIWCRIFLLNLVDSTICYYNSNYIDISAHLKESFVILNILSKTTGMCQPFDQHLLRIYKLIPAYFQITGSCTTWINYSITGYKPSAAYINSQPVFVAIYSKTWQYYLYCNTQDYELFTISRTLVSQSVIFSCIVCLSINHHPSQIDNVFLSVKTYFTIFSDYMQLQYMENQLHDIEKSPSYIYKLTVSVCLHVI